MLSLVWKALENAFVSFPLKMETLMKKTPTKQQNTQTKTLPPPHTKRKNQLKSAENILSENYPVVYMF